MNSDIVDSKVVHQDANKVFKKLGTCSRTFFYILNHEFGYPKETEERAADSLAGGIMQKGHQCGMLWGSSLAVGAEAYRKCDNLDQAIGVAIKATQNIMASFSKRENTIKCRDITHCDFSSKLSFAKYFFTGRFLYCFKLAKLWAPEAIQSAIEGLSLQESDLPQVSISCASEVARKMEASDEEMVMVAGFAGGLGLSGNACGALSAAIWMKSIAWCRENDEKSSFKNPNAKLVLKAFQENTNAKILCSDITGQRFNTISNHSKFIKEGGCEQLINAIAQS
jgi:hypothetical protein